MRIERNRIFVLLLLAVTLTACTTVGPKFVKPQVTVNPDWSMSNDVRVARAMQPDPAWWRAFNDPTLDRLIDVAYRQNLPLQIQGLRIAEARAQLALAAGSKYPQLQQLFASASAIGLSENMANLVPNFRRNFWDFQVGFDVGWEIDFWGKYANLERSAGANYAASIADYDSALVSLTAEVARTYALVRTFETLRDLAAKNVELQQEGYRIADSRFRNGATSELDVSQAKTLLESTRTTIPQIEISLRQSENALATLLGQPAGTVQELLRTSNGIPQPPPQIAVSVPAELLRRRPDIRAAEFRALSESARVGVAVADLYPSISINGTVGLMWNSGNSGGSPFFYAVGPSLNLPIFDYGRRQNRIRIEDARLQQALVGYQETVLEAAQEVEDGMTGYLKSRDASQFAEGAATAAQRSVDISFTQYREGAVDFQRVIEAMRQLLQQQNTLAQTRSAVATNLAALYKALGGGWELRQDQPFISDNIRKEMEARTRWGDLLSPIPSSQTAVDNREELHHE